MELFVGSSMGPKLVDTLAQDASIDEIPCGYLITKPNDTKWGLYVISKLRCMHGYDGQSV